MARCNSRSRTMQWTTSENATENEAVEPAAAVSEKAVHDQLIDSLSSTVSSAWS